MISFLKISHSFVVTLSFRASIGDGILFYIADNETTPTQYVSLELVDGKLHYEFNNGINIVSIETGNTTTYYGQGEWYKVSMFFKQYIIFRFLRWNPSG